jgi:hypothetical protein
MGGDHSSTTNHEHANAIGIPATAPVRFRWPGFSCDADRAGSPSITARPTRPLRVPQPLRVPARPNSPLARWKLIVGRVLSFATTSWSDPPFPIPPDRFSTPQPRRRQRRRFFFLSRCSLVINHLRSRMPWRA